MPLIGSSFKFDLQWSTQWFHHFQTSQQCNQNWWCQCMALFCLLLCLYWIKFLWHSRCDDSWISSFFRLNIYITACLPMRKMGKCHYFVSSVDSGLYLFTTKMIARHSRAQRTNCWLAFVLCWKAEDANLPIIHLFIRFCVSHSGMRAFIEASRC